MIAANDSSGPTRESVRIGGRTIAELNDREVEAPDYPDLRMHLTECPVCGQTFDRRLLGDTAYHLTLSEGHSPLEGEPPHLVPVEG